MTPASAAHLLARTEQRRTWNITTRIEQSENDLDAHDAAFVRIEEKLDRLNARIYGFIIALAVATVTFAGGLALHH